MKITFFLLVFVVCAVGAAAQTNSAPGNVNINKPLTVLPDTARYQLVKLEYISPIIINGMIKLDRYNGKTSIYDPGRRRWILLSVRGGLPAASSDSPKYQIFSEGETLTFLLNSETGQSWVLNVQIWEPVAD
ncbi:MAG TPA: hypothetical protein VIL74_18240 [Pyrinomonadaceae bacterium]